MAAFARIGFCLLMSKTFRPWTIDQPLLLPPSVQDFVGEDHLARFILALVLEPLDLGEIEAAYASERGQPPFDPAMMTALLLYGYCNGVYSSRRIAKAARERVDFLEHCRARSAGFSHRLRLPQAALEGACGTVRASSQAVRTGGTCEARPCRARRDEDQGERHQAQGDELRAHGEACGGARGRGRAVG